MGGLMIAAAVMLAAGGAQAATLYVVDAGASSVSAHGAGDGLLLGTNVLVADGYSFSLDFVGDTHTFNFFKVWTPESWVNEGEDTTAKPITATLAFSTPASAGTVSGESAGLNIFAGFYQAGQITWNGPTYVSAATGDYKITLSDVTFGESFWWDGPSSKGAKVKATIEQISEAGAGGPQIVVPLPAAVWGGLALMGMVVVRRIAKMRDEA
jgi:hypothetical protein